MKPSLVCAVALQCVAVAHALNNCKDRNRNHGQCEEMAGRGDCTASPGWMAVFCAHSCNVCELRDPVERCKPERMGMSMDDAFKPGELDELFESLKEKYPEYSVQSLSSPKNDGPHVARFNNFISDEEIDALLHHTRHELKRSTGQGGFDEEGVQAQEVIHDRTSKNAWCDDMCMNDPLVQKVVARISSVTGVDPDNYESFQILRYEPGQFYATHHDTSSEDSDSLSGPRVLTFFMYLSDVEEGGGTNFPYVTGGEAGEDGLTATPKKGSAILWPSVHSDDLTKQLHSTHHQALPVIKGTKFAANAWIHMRSYNKPNLWGCTGSFTAPEGDESEVADEEEKPAVDSSARQIVIRNDLDLDTIVYWVPPDGGALVPIKELLQRNQEFGSNSFLGHVFEVHEVDSEELVAQFKVADGVKEYPFSQHAETAHDEL